MDSSPEQICLSEFLHLPRDVITTIFEYCDTQSLGRLARTCKTLKQIIYSEDSVWKQSSQNVFGSNMAAQAMQKRCKPVLSYRDRCRVSKSWYRELGKTITVAHYKKCMPWIVLDQEFLYCNIGKSLVQYKRNENGDVYLSSPIEVFPSEDDISKFAVNDSEVVCGTRDGKLVRLNKDDMYTVHSVVGHSKDILAVDSRKDIIVSGSKDSSLKIWKSKHNGIECKREISLSNRVLSTSIMPSNVSFIAGTPGTKTVHPLQLFDLERATHISNFGQTYRYGAGILDIFSESPNTFYSCGYDTSLRLWDIRSPNSSVLKWTEPFDSSLYCVQTDYNVTIITGTARNGSFLIWDKRLNRIPVKHYYIPNLNTSGKRYIGLYKGPVYSVAFDATHIYVAFEQNVLQYSYF